MKRLIQISAACLLVLGFMSPMSATAQLNLGLAGGIDIETDGTMVGLAANMNVAMLNVGLNAEFGEGEEIAEICQPVAGNDCKFTFDVIRFMVPISYPVALGEGGFMLYPFIAPGVYSWSCDACDGQSEFSLDAGVRAQYNIVMAAASYGFLENTPDFTFRLGFLFPLGQ